MRNTAPAASTLPIELFNDTGLHYVRVEGRDDEPGPRRGVVDIAVLDMHHRYANLGHSSIVETLLGFGHTERKALGAAAPEVRVISYDLRGSGAVPRSPASRFPIVIGTGGPGALDPRLNDGISEWSQGVLEDPAWEARLFRFFDDVLATEGSAFMGVCHSFGLLCRWSGVAEAVLRTPEKGKSAGVVRNLLSEQALSHPWFSGYHVANSGRAIEVLDSRLFDLIPTGFRTDAFLANEVNGNGLPGPAVTMLELARDREGVLPRIWGVNHHPEIGDRGLQRKRLQRLSERGEVTPEWVTERTRALDAWNQSAHTEHRLQSTSAFTFERPLHTFVRRALRAHL